MPSIATPRTFVARAESLARIFVQGSAALAVMVGCLVADAPLAVAAGGTFVTTAVMAWWRFEATTAVVLFVAYLNGAMMLSLPASLAGAPLWLVAMSGLVAGGTSWHKWSAPLAWRWPLILWLLGVALSWPIIAARETDFSLLTARGGLAVVIVGALAYLSAGLWLDTLLSWNAETIERRVARPLLASAIVSACAVFYQGFVDMSWLSNPLWIALRRAPGMMGDANPMAVALGIWAPLALAMVGARRPAVLGWLVMVTLWCAAWQTGARTFLLLLFTGLVGVTKGLLTGLGRKRLLAIVLGGTVVTLAIIAFLPLGLFNSGPVGRLVSNFPVRQPWVILYEAFWYRGGYGVAAVESFRQHPWSGVGVGAFNHIQGDYNPQRIMAPDNAQNFWRHALAERGILAFVAVLALTLRTCSLLVRRSRASTLLASTLKATIVGLGFALMFGVPTQNVAIAVTGAALIAWLHASGLQPEAFGARRYTAALMTASALAIAGAVVDGWKAVTELRPAVRAARTGGVYAYGLGEPQIGPDGSRGRTILGRAVAAVPVTSSEYVVRYWMQGSRDGRLQVWRDGTMVMDEVILPGVVSERVLPIPPRPGGVLLEFETDSSDVVVAARFR